MTADDAPQETPPRLVLLMGSGELTPTMAKVHRAVIDRLGGPPLSCAFLDTPFAFQENAAELAERAVTYFRDRLRSPLGVASLGRDEGARDDFAAEQAAATLRRARYVFAGPGSPSHALEHWRSSVVPPLLLDKLRNGGALGFSSAAALTLGSFTIPVYEIYKVGQPPHWLEGLDILAAIGWRVAVVPHYDNAEGGTHDTRYCYLGERRLRLLEDQLPEDAFVLGVDEHTAVLCDLGADTAVVHGRGGMTLRRCGESLVFDSGTTVALHELSERAVRLGGGTSRGVRSVPSLSASTRDERARLGSVEADFDRALEAGEPREVVRSLLALEAIATAEEEGAPDTARLVLRSLLLRLEGPLGRGLTDMAETVGPYVELLLRLRAEARAERRFELGDEIRDGLAALGVEVRDTPDGSAWLLASRVAQRAD